MVLFGTFKVYFNANTYFFFFTAVADYSFDLCKMSKKCLSRLSDEGNCDIQDIKSQYGHKVRDKLFTEALCRLCLSANLSLGAPGSLQPLQSL